MSQFEPTAARIRVLFVCLGNICRSPMAEGIFRSLVTQQGLEQRIEIDSAGTHAYHVDEPPDRRAQAALRARGMDISGLRGRQVSAADFLRFDYVLAMDRENLENLRAIAPPEYQDMARLFLEYGNDHRIQEVPDPYYGGAAGFDTVFELCHDAAQGLLADIRVRYGLLAS
ncbi:MAG TPA: low molecular weight protein-tyrosine-phosphatase [Acidiferrobacteraceae bacterium]|nr:low molecular weight protein-tyrosine-phosphatase [Acidiferrobacteraceae bacterium]